MSKPVINIDHSLFLKDYQTFEKFLLPVINRQREDKGEAPLTGSDAMDRYLDLVNEFGMSGEHKRETNTGTS